MTNIEEILCACLPAISSIISMVAIVAGLYAKFNHLIMSVNDKTDQQEIIDALQANLEEDKQAIRALVERNDALRQEVAELIQKIDKIRKS